MSAHPMTLEPDLETPSPSPTSTWKTVGGLVLGLLIFFLVAALLGALFMEPLRAVGATAVERFGLAGLLVAVVLVDMIPTPLSYVPFMLLALAGGIPFVEVLAVSATSSYLAGLLGYGVGHWVGMPARLESWMTRRHPRIRSLIDRYGGWGVAAIGALPLPLALGTWSAGALRIRFSQVALALLVRFPKTALYLWMLHSGLNLGTG